jgi:hypothetical protein
MARFELGALHTQLQKALARGGYDVLTRAHLEELASDADRALKAQTVISTAVSKG